MPISKKFLGDIYLIFGKNGPGGLNCFPNKVRVIKDPNNGGPPNY